MLYDYTVIIYNYYILYGIMVFCHIPDTMPYQKGQHKELHTHVFENPQTYNLFQ